MGSPLLRWAHGSLSGTNRGATIGTPRQ